MVICLTVNMEDASEMKRTVAVDFVLKHYYALRCDYVVGSVSLFT